MDFLETFLCCVGALTIVLFAEGLVFWCSKRDTFDEESRDMKRRLNEHDALNEALVRDQCKLENELSVVKKEVETLRRQRFEIVLREELDSAVISEAKTDEEENN